MATREALAIRADAAIDRIIDRLQSQAVNIDPDSVPRINKDRELLRAIQLELIADLLDGLQGGGIPQKYLTAERLASEGATKAEIVDALLS